MFSEPSIVKPSRERPQLEDDEPRIDPIASIVIFAPIKEPPYKRVPV